MEHICAALNMHVHPARPLILSKVKTTRKTASQNEFENSGSFISRCFDAFVFTFSNNLN